jgi:holo-[acyl-carrier protein] synthase
MIIGIGTDIEDIVRVRAAITNGGSRLKEDILFGSELDLETPEHIAGIFCAKESLMKAAGRRLVMNEIEVKCNCIGAPHIVTRGYTKGVMDGLGVKSIFVSISHSSTHATSVVVLEG